MINAMIIDPKDDVVVAIEEIKMGDAVSYMLDGKPQSLPAIQDVTIFHKLARRDIAQGAPVSKYGEHIGVASRDIKAGEHVHVHNIESRREELQD